MFVNFDRVFNEQEQAKAQIPEALVKYLSSELPEGLKYSADQNGLCHIVSEGTSLTIGGFKFHLTEDQRKTIGENATLDDVLKYSYNSQQSISLELVKPGVIVLNGQEVAVERMSYNPYNPVRIIESSYYAVPQKFSSSFDISVSGNGYEMTLNISRVPNQSVHIAKYESADDKPLKVIYYMNENDRSLSLTMTAQLKNAQTVQELLECMQIYNAYVSGQGKMCGMALEGNFDTKKRKRFNKKTISFWEKVLKLEQLLDVSFILPNEDVPYSIACEVEQLYQNLILNKPVRDNQQINSVNSLTMNHVEDEKRIKTSIGTLLMFQFEGTYEFDIFGVKKTLPCFECVFNAKLKDYQNEEGKFKLILEDKSADEPMYSSILCFTDDEKLKVFKAKNKESKRNFTNTAKRFEKAKKASDYL